MSDEPRLTTARQQQQTLSRRQQSKFEQRLPVRMTLLKAQQATSEKPPRNIHFRRFSARQWLLSSPAISSTLAAATERAIGRGGRVIGRDELPNLAIKCALRHRALPRLLAKRASM